MKKNQKGFSMVEIIIVISVIALLAGVSISLVGQVRLANTKKTVKELETVMEKQRIQTMTKSGKPYLFIYKLGDGYYCKSIATDDLTTVTIDQLDNSGTKICGNNGSIYMESVTGNQLDDARNNVIRIRYTKSGAFDVGDVTISGGGTQRATNVSQIVVKGSGTTTLKLSYNTGKVLED